MRGVCPDCDHHYGSCLRPRDIAERQRAACAMAVREALSGVIRFWPELMEVIMNTPLVPADEGE